MQNCNYLINRPPLCEYDHFAPSPPNDVLRNFTYIKHCQMDISIHINFENCLSTFPALVVLVTLSVLGLDQLWGMIDRGLNKGPDWSSSYSQALSKQHSAQDIVLKSKLRPANSWLHRKMCFFFYWNKSQLWPSITRPCRPSTQICHTFSEPSGHGKSPGITYYTPHLLKSWANRDWVIRFLGYFEWFLRSRAQII